MSLLGIIAGAARRRGGGGGGGADIISETVGLELVAAELSHDVALPSGISSGDLLLIFVAVAGNALPCSAVGWGATTHGRVTVLTRVADGSEGSSVAVTTSSTRRKAAIVYQIRGQSGAAEITGATGLTTPELTPVSTCALWLTFVADTATNYEFSAPADFGTLITAFSDNSNSTNTNMLRIASARRSISQSSQAAATWGRTGTANTPACMMVAIPSAIP